MIWMLQNIRSKFLIGVCICKVQSMLMSNIWESIRGNMKNLAKESLVISN